MNIYEYITSTYFLFGKNSMGQAKAQETPVDWTPLTMQLVSFWCFALLHFSLTVLKHRITQKWIERELSGASAVYDLAAEAMSLVLWRAADCGVNGVSDAVYKSKLPGAKSTMRHLNAICPIRFLMVSDGFWWFLWEVARRDSATVRIFQGTGVSQHPSRSVAPCFSTRPRCRHQRQAQVVSWKWTPAFAAASGNFGRVAFERWDTLGLQWKPCFHLFSDFFNILPIF